jgi:hypothetical protein
LILIQKKKMKMEIFGFDGILNLKFLSNPVYTSQYSYKELCQ